MFVCIYIYIYTHIYLLKRTGKSPANIEERGLEQEDPEITDDEAEMGTFCVRAVVIYHRIVKKKVHVPIEELCTAIPQNYQLHDRANLESFLLEDQEVNQFQFSFFQ